MARPQKAYKLKEKATWTDFMKGYASVDHGDILNLPKTTKVVQEASLMITKPIDILRTSPDSTLLALGDLNMSGSAQQIAIGYGGGKPPYTTVDGVMLDFNMEHTRNDTNRMIAISIFGHSKNIRIHDMKFKNITSDCIITRNESAIESQNGVIEDIYIYNCIVDEWYESFFNHHEGSISRCHIYNNCGTLFAGGHPNWGVSRPYGAILNIEETRYPGLIEDINIYANSFVSDLYNWTLGKRVADGHGTDFIDSIGFTLRRNENPDFRAHNVYVDDNRFKGWDRSLWHIQTQTVGGSLLFPGPSCVSYTRNKFEEFGTFNGVTIDDWGAPGDEVVFGDNDIYKSFDGQTVPVFPGSSGVVKITQEPANRIHG